MNVALSHEEHDAIRERLVEYMEYLPRTRERVPVVETAPLLRWSLFPNGRHLAGALALALMVTTTTYSVTSAATEALPGDLLWPVKVHVNEGVKTVLTSGDEERVAWERERVELRLEEASSLAAQGRLDEKLQDVVSKQFVIQAEAVVRKVREIEERDPVLAAEASAELADTLDTHKAVLARMVVEQEAEGPIEEGARTLVKEVHRVAHDAEVLRNETEENLAFGDVNETATTSGVGTSDGEQGNTAASGTEIFSIATFTPVVVLEGAELSIQDRNGRAAYRARNRAVDLRVQAEALVVAKVQTDELVSLAQSHVAAGTVRVSEGDAALADGDLSRAYAAFRGAASIFHKTIALLKVAETYTPEVTMSMLEEHSLVSDTFTSANIEHSDVIGAASRDVVTSSSTGTPSQHEFVTREEAADIIKEVRNMLVERNTDSTDAALGAHTLVKDAAASMFRADIALSLGKSDEAAMLFKQAQAHAMAAQDLLEGEQNVPESLSNPAHEEGQTPPEEEHSMNVLTPSSLTVLHSLEGSTHTYEGTIPATSCVSVHAKLLSAEVPQTVLSLELTTTPAIDEGVCVGGSEVSYRATTTAPVAADLTSVFFNGEAVTWSLKEVSSIVKSQEDDRLGHGLLRRALEGAQEMLY